MDNTKKCNRCNLILPISEFYKEKNKIKTPCKKCHNKLSKENHKKWRETEEGRLKLRASQKKCGDRKKERNRIIKEQKRIQKENEKKELMRLKSLEKQRKIDLKNEKIKLREIEKQRQKEISKLKKRERDKQKWKRKWETKEHFAIKVRLRNLIRNSFSRKGYSKSSKTNDILGIDYNGLIEYIQSKFQDGMTWENRGSWHIDHIIPLSSAKNEEDIIKLCHYTNLQPLWAKDNLMKGDKIF